MAFQHYLYRIFTQTICICMLTLIYFMLMSFIVNVGWKSKPLYHRRKECYFWWLGCEAQYYMTPFLLSGAYYVWYVNVHFFSGQVHSVSDIIGFEAWELHQRYQSLRMYDFFSIFFRKLPRNVLQALANFCSKNIILVFYLF